MLDRKLVAVGHGRGATSFTDAWLNAQGIRTRHEGCGRDGVVDSAFSVPGYILRNSAHATPVTRDDFNFDHKVCVLRDPWKVIATYYTVEHPDAIWHHARYIPLDAAKGDHLNAIALSVARWTRSGIAYAGRTVQAEEMDKEMLPLLIEWGLLPENHTISPVPKNVVNHRLGRRLTRDEIVDRLHADVAAELFDYVREAGYE